MAPSSAGRGRLQPREQPTRSNDLGGNPSSTRRWTDVPCGTTDEMSSPWDPKTRRNNLYRGLAVMVGRSKRTCELTSSIVPQGTSVHRWWSSSFLLSRLVISGCHAAAASLVQRNSVPSTQIRCRITANRRASATMALFIPRRLAICIAQALSQDHRVERSMLCAAS